MRGLPQGARAGRRLGARLDIGHQPGTIPLDRGDDHRRPDHAQGQEGCLDLRRLDPTPVPTRHTYVVLDWRCSSLRSSQVWVDGPAPAVLAYRGWCHGLTV